MACLRTVFLGAVVIALCIGTHLSVALASDARVVVYYFHTSYRYMLDMKAERYTRQAMDRYYGDSDRVSFKLLNSDVPANKHFVADYGLSGKDVVVSLIKDGKEKKFERLNIAWNSVMVDIPAYGIFLKGKVEEFLALGDAREEPKVK